MKRTAISIAVGALSIGLSQGLLAQDEETEINERQQMTQEGAQVGEHEQGSQAQGAEVRVEGEAAEVTVEQEPANIRVEQQPPNVTVQQQAPQVTIEQPDPNVTVEQADPNVTVEEVGEASVRVERAQEVDAEMHDSDQQDQAQQGDQAQQDPSQQRDQAQQDPSQQGDQAQQDPSQPDRDQASRDQDSQGNDLLSMNVGDIEGYTIYSRADGKEIGDVERVVRDTQNDDIYVVVTTGGFLGFGKNEFGYKLDDVELRGDEELVVHSSDDGVAGDYGSDRYESLDGNHTFSDSMQRRQGQGN